jgi:Ca2+-binding RTX toxin-like protein
MTYRIRRFALATVAAVIFQLGIAPAVITSAQLPFYWVYPGGCHSGLETTLQQCIDDANPGDTVAINTDTPIVEDLFIQKSLALVANPGRHPTIGFVGVNDGGTSGAMDVFLVGLTHTGRINAEFSGGSGHTLTIDGVGIDPPPSLSSQADITFGVSVPATLTVRHSRLHVTGDTDDAFEMNLQPSSGQVNVALVGNRISGHGNASTNDGISLSAQGAGTVRADIDNNSIWDISGCSGCAAVAVAATGSGTAVVNVVGNTVEKAAQGLYVLSLTGALTVNAFNNVFSHESGSAIFLTSSNPSTLAFHGGFNDFFANGQVDQLEGHSLGTGNLHLAPKYVKASAGNLQLLAGSPLIDAGVVCSPGGVVNLDAAGDGRLAGPSVDMGAYERGAGLPTGEVLLGTPSNDSLVGTTGADILCGYGGADLLTGKGGADYLDGGGGADIIFGGAGPDRLFGRGGNDTLCAHDGIDSNDHLDGGPGSDGYRADPGDSRTAVEHAATCVA